MRLMNGGLVAIRQTSPNTEYGADKQSQDENPWVGMPKPNRPGNHESQRHKPDGNQNEVLWLKGPEDQRFVGRR